MTIQQNIISNFEALCEIEQCQEKPNHFKLRSYRKIIKLFSNETNMEQFQIDDFKLYLQQNGMKNPKKTILKITEILNNGKLSELQKTTINYEKIKSIKDLTSVYGIGIKKAKELMKLQITSVEQLKESVIKDDTIINKKQLIGLNYHEDLLKRIPRNEICEFETIIETIITKNYSNQIKFTISGSYRRNSKTSGDIDLLVTSNTLQSLNLLYKDLYKMNIIKETLAKGKKKFMGVISYNNYPHRHLDIIETTQKDYAFAILYFTGSGAFNVRFRKHALDKGYSLNEYTMKHKNGEQLNTQLIKNKIKKNWFETERDIFDFLDFPYVSPELRV